MGTTRNAAADTAIYVRISKDRKGERQGVDRQAADCAALAKQRGWKVAAKYEDNDTSASKYTRRRRPQFRALMRAITEGRVSRVVCWKLDRLYRQPRELEDLIDWAEAGKVQVVAVLGGEIDLNTSAGRGMARVGVAMNAVASDDTSERITRQKAERRKEGRPPGGYTPFGWKDKTTVDPEQAKVLVAAMDAALGGESLASIARKWNADKVRGRAGWDANIIGKILTRPHHAGLLIHGGQVLPTKTTWKPLISREKYEALVATVAGRAAPGSHAPRRTSMLTGLLRCGACGHVMYRSSTGANDGDANVWRCHTGASRGEGCGKVTVREKHVEPLVVEATIQYVDGLNLAKLLSKTGAQGDTARALAALDKRAAEFGVAAAMGKFNPTAMGAFTETIDAQRAVLRTKLAGEVKRDALAPYAGRAGALRATWPTLSVDQRRSIIAESLHVVVVKPVQHRGQRFETKRIEVGAPVSGWDTLPEEAHRVLSVRTPQTASIGTRRRK